MSHTRGTFAALVDAIIPETPGLAARGDEHVPGGLAVDLDTLIVERVNAFQEVRGGALAALGYDTTPLAPFVAALLDVAAIELLARRSAVDGLTAPADAFATGPFSRLSREDRLRALRLLEDAGALPALADRLDSTGLATLQYLASALPILIQFTYYSELPGDGEGSQGWRQTGYPGPADGYEVLLGYELEAFEENEY